MYNQCWWALSRQTFWGLFGRGNVRALGLAAAFVLSGIGASAFAQRSPDVLAPGAGPLAVWEDVPGCLNGDPTAPISLCETSLPEDAHVERALVHLWFLDFEGARGEAIAALTGTKPPGEPELFMARLLLTEFHSTNDRAALRSGHEYAIRSLLSAGQIADKLATLGAIEEAAADWQGALKHFGAAIGIDRNHVFARHRRALLMASREMTVEALADADKLTELQPDGAAWYELRAKLRVDVRDFQGAVADYTRALELGGHEYASLLGRGLANAMIGTLREAIEDFTALIDGGEAARFAMGGEELADMLQQRGALLLRLGNGPDAARDYLRSLEIGGAQAALRLQLTLNRLGWEITVDGVVTEELRRALSECFVSRRCQPAVLQRA